MLQVSILAGLQQSIFGCLVMICTSELLYLIPAHVPLLVKILLRREIERGKLCIQYGSLTMTTTSLAEMGNCIHNGTAVRYSV